MAHGGLATMKVMWFPNCFKVFWVLLLLRANDSDCIRAKDHGICQAGLWGTLLKPLLLLLYFQIIYFVVYHSVFDAAPGGHFYSHLMCFSNLISSLVECYALTQRLSCFKKWTFITWVHISTSVAMWLWRHPPTSRNQKLRSLFPTHSAGVKHHQNDDTSAMQIWGFG